MYQYGDTYLLPNTLICYELGQYFFRKLLLSKMIPRESGGDILICLVSAFRAYPHKRREYFEQELRAIIYPKRDVFEPLEDPHPDMFGFSLSIDNESRGELSPVHFIEAIYVHPTLSVNSITFQAVKEINRLFGMAEFPIIADKVEALGLGRQEMVEGDRDTPEAA